MKTFLSPKAKQLGAALLVAMCISAFLCICITGYLSLAEHQNYMSARSQAWNMSIAMTEAGVEEGMEQLNTTSTNMSANGWSFDGSSYYRSNSFADGNYYIVNIWMTNINVPVLIARAYTTPPTLAKANGGIYFAAYGANGSGPASLSRAVKVTCSRGNLFLAALSARHSIDMNGNGIYTDSFNSQDPLKSTNHKYDASVYQGDMGDVLSNGGIQDSVSIGNGNVYGKVHIAPTSPLSVISIGSNGGVGTHAWQAGNKGAEPGYEIQDANFTFPDTVMPNTSSYLSLPPGGTIITSSNWYTTNAITGSPTYPNPVPSGSTVITNFAFATNNTWIPTPAATNYATTLYSKVSTYPSPGTYEPGSLSTNTSGNKYTYYGYTSTNYSFVIGMTYNYSTFNTNATYFTNTYDYILTANNNYVAGSLASKKTYLSGPNITLVVTNGLDGTENITWASGAYLTVYAGGTSVGVAGNNYINPNGAAASLIIYCAKTITSFSLSGNGQFTGILYAPDADLALNGGGSSAEDFCGCIVCNSATLNGHYRFHYDESLSGPSNNGRYLVSSWNEIP